ncbi:MAG: T9SS type A sorting domain-containing protein, partial [Candidatus Neomarinimicrobiota bacterium]
RYQIAKPCKVTLMVYDLLGKKVLTLVNTEQPAGSYSVALDGRQLASGVYFYHIQAGTFRQTRKMILMK